MTITIQTLTMPQLPTISIPVPVFIGRYWKWLLLSFVIGVIIFLITHVKVIEGINATNNYCDNLNYQRWQKNWPVYCEMRGLSKDCVSAEGPRDGSGRILEWECGE